MVLVLLTIYAHRNYAQDIHTNAGAVTTQFSINENSVIYDKSTGKRISYAEYRRLLNEKPGAYRTALIYNEFGEIGGFSLRAATAEELHDSRKMGLDTSLTPKAGTPMPLFVMKGLDGKTYRSNELVGNVIIISFWVKTSRPFWNPGFAASMAEVLKPYEKHSDLISLGILDESKSELEKFAAAQLLPFMPIPDSYGFHRKFGISTAPSFIVVDKKGNIAALISGPEFDELAEVLKKVIK